MSSMLLRSAVGVDADADRKYGPAWRRLVCLPDRGRVEGDGAAPISSRAKKAGRLRVFWDVGWSVKNCADGSAGS